VISEITDAEFSAVRSLAQRLMGVSLAPAKKPLVIARLGAQARRLGCNTFHQYLELIQSSANGEELQRALDLLTTNETYFFREPAHFDFLRDRILPAASGGFRAWSAACSSGEEPYSIAMLLTATAGARPWEVVATDISTRMLARAERGLYEDVRGRNLPLEYVRRFCLRGTGPHAGQFLVSTEIRHRVRFIHANLNAELPPLGAFDVVFLRNVMIYFDQAVKADLLARITPMIRPGGYLLIGHCETLHGLPHSLQPVQASIYRRTHS